MSGRIRSIKPEVLEDELAASLSDAAWRLWVSLWVLADDHGNVRVGDRYLAASVWQDTTRDAATPRAELAATGLVTLYAVNGQRYGHINGWEKHQRVDNAGKPRVPTPEEDDGTWDGVATSDINHLPSVSRKVSATLGGLPLARASRAQSGRQTSDHDHDHDHGAAAVAATASTPEPTTRPESQRKVNARSSRGSRIPLDWRPSPETEAWCRKLGVDADRVREEFVDFWADLPGKKAEKITWDATFRNRVRDLIKQGRAPDLPLELPIHRAPNREKFIPKSAEEVADIMGKDAVIAT